MKTILIDSRVPPAVLAIEDAGGTKINGSVLIVGVQIIQTKNHSFLQRYIKPLNVVEGAVCKYGMPEVKINVVFHMLTLSHRNIGLSKVIPLEQQWLARMF